MTEKRYYRVFVSSVSEGFVDNRRKIIDCVLLNDCFPVAMEYFSTNHQQSSLTLCRDKILNSDGVILLVGNRYGSLIGKKEVEGVFENSVIPFECPEQLSFTHFEYLFAKHLDKKMTVIVFNSSTNDNLLNNFIHEVQKDGYCFNVSDEKEFDRKYYDAVNKLIQAIKENDDLGLLEAKKYLDYEKRVKLLEDEIADGYQILENKMGAIFGKDGETIHFYVNKKMKVLKDKDKINFNVHIYSNQEEEVRLTKEFLNAKAFIRYKKKDSYKINDYMECEISEKAYGREYLMCYINFVDKDNISIDLSEGDEIDILYTYSVKRNLYGYEIGRRSSIFFEKLIVEIAYPQNTKIDFCTIRESNGTTYRVDGLSSDDIKEEINSSILINNKIDTFFTNLQSLEGYRFKVVNLNPKLNNRTVHYYVRWR